MDNQNERARLTNSAMATARQCARKYYYRYRLGITKDTEFKALRYGSAVHRGVEVWRTTGNVAEAIQSITEIDESYELAEICTLIAGYAWVYQNDDLQITRVEREWEMPLVNPDTGGTSRTFVLAGKIDATTQTGILEMKTCSESIAPDSQYWQRLAIDPQISLYTLAARQLGIDVSHVIYDVIRKPCIAPKQVPVLDDTGAKIVTDASGARAMNKNGTPRQTGGDGYTVLTRVETPEEFSDRLLEDIKTRPEFYFARREIPMLDDHLDEFRAEVWQQADALREAGNKGRWFRNVNRWTCPFCEYADLCLTSRSVREGDPIPQGYVHTEPNSELAAPAA